MKNLQKYIGFLLRNTEVGKYLNTNISYSELNRLGIRKNEWGCICNIKEVMSAGTTTEGIQIQLTRYPFTKIFNFD